MTGSILAYCKEVNTRLSVSLGTSTVRVCDYIARHSDVRRGCTGRRLPVGAYSLSSGSNSQCI